ncbi:hypothetical protein BIW11_03383 [Tropilaelaps mercedesae]|uniref:Flavodoxin-like domain-containing protein n=1 Tax=Tropilaelaps mercedesae TaxID=418985 RepID=A0A1V9XMW8_9ACAR|nr:hypothetical protein BIW11_03383 [Tropilaelaps mercedesae]
MALAVVFWTLGSAVVTFVVAAFIWVGILLLIRDNVKKDEKKKTLLTLALGAEAICKRIAHKLEPCARLNTKSATCPVEDILKYIVHGNRVLLFIVRKELSGEVEKLVTFLQHQVDKLYASQPIEHKQLYHSLRYAVFGIGDTSEARDEFNRLAMKIDMNLRILGATRVVPMRLYDFTTSPVTVDEEFNEWFDDLAPETEIPTVPLNDVSVDEEYQPKGILAERVKAVPTSEPDEEDSEEEADTMRDATNVDLSTQSTPSSDESQSCKRGSSSPELLTSSSPKCSHIPQGSPKDSPKNGHKCRSNMKPAKVKGKARSHSKETGKGKSKSDKGSKNTHGKRSRPKKDLKPHGRGASDSDESSSDEDWEVMEIPVEDAS